MMDETLSSEFGKVIFIRSGALGDFILSLPLLRVLREYNRELILLTRRAYLELIDEDNIYDSFIDIDSSLASFFFNPSSVVDDKFYHLIKCSQIYLFYVFDAEINKKLLDFGAERVFWLNSRPLEPPHVVERFFLDSGLTVPQGVMNTPLWDREMEGCSLWIHPGSGSDKKNSPVSHFADLALEWRETRGSEIFVSFGEADSSLIDKVDLEFGLRSLPYNRMLKLNIGQLKRELIRHAACYFGNDSGVSHLASALGISCHIFYTVTDPAIWRPIGNSRTEYFSI